MRREFGAVSDR